MLQPQAAGLGRRAPARARLNQGVPGALVAVGFTLVPDGDCYALGL